MSTVGSRPTLRSTGTGVCTRKCYYVRLQEVIIIIISDYCTDFIMSIYVQVSDYSILFCYGNMKAHVEKHNMLGWQLL